MQTACTREYNHTYVIMMNTSTRPLELISWMSSVGSRMCTAEHLRVIHKSNSITDLGLPGLMPSDLVEARGASRRLEMMYVTILLRNVTMVCAEISRMHVQPCHTHRALSPQLLLQAVGVREAGYVQEQRVLAQALRRRFWIQTRQLRAKPLSG